MHHKYVVTDAERVWTGSTNRTDAAPDSVHDYMHAKFDVSEDEVIAGSYNLFKGGEENAENALHIVDEATAERFASLVDAVATRYATPAATVPGSSAAGQAAARGHQPQ
jgi:hypothetical protein